MITKNFERVKKNQEKLQVHTREDIISGFITFNSGGSPIKRAWRVSNFGGG